MVDLLILHAKIIDGTGNPWYYGNVAVKDGRFVAVGSFDPPQAKKVIDAKGAMLCPGFIDVHTHNDILLTYDPSCLSKLQQGVTTQIVGNCGFSAAPLCDATKHMLQSYAEPSLGEWANEGNWHTFGEYLDRIERLPLAGNVGSLVGSGTVRMAVKGFKKTAMSKSEMQEVKKYIAEALESGAMGFSMGLTYTPDNFYTNNELLEISELLAKYKTVMAVHMRGEGDSLLRSVNEMITIAEKTGVSVEISHFKAAGKNNWNSNIYRAMELIDDARSRGLQITCDVYPYTACFSEFPYLMPPWALEGGIEEAVKRVQIPEIRAKIREEMESRQELWDSMIYSTGWENVRIATTVNPEHKEFEGRTIAEIAAERGMEATECGLDLFCENNGKLGFIFDFLCEEDIKSILKWNNSFVASDSTYVNNGLCHPRMFGTNIRILTKYARDEKIISLEQAIRKMTSFPAEKFSIKGKGLILKGYDSDFVIFNLEKLKDNATYENPKRSPDGIGYVFVAGEMAVCNGKYTGSHSGKLLRKKNNV